jgi:hypothetical protein
MAFLVLLDMMVEQWMDSAGILRGDSSKRAGMYDC